jgi:hypothetical protein
LREKLIAFLDVNSKEKILTYFSILVQTGALQFFDGFFYVVQDYIIIKHGNFEKSHYLVLMTKNIKKFNYSFLNIIINTFTNLKYVFHRKIFFFLSLNQIFLKKDFQKNYYQNGGKRTEKANELNNFLHPYTKNYYSYYYKPNFNMNFGKKLNSGYLNVYQKVSYRYYKVQDLLKNDRLKNNIQEWSSNEILVRLKNEVTQEQITLVNLVSLNGLCSENVKKFQTKLMRSLKFRIIAVYKIFKNKEFNTAVIDNICFNDNQIAKRKICWKIVQTLHEITYHPKNYQSFLIKKV